MNSIPSRALSVLLAAFATAGTATAARADYVQLFDRDGRGYVPLARVEVAGRSWLSDRYGRVELNLPAGWYAARVTVNGTTRSVVFTLDGSRTMKAVRLP